ncbi:MAG: helix-turn-helix domain-containing protein [Flavobacteriaceae bacterium]|nr:helix-turn-helix domain-containing protein [Flavobacteriaceae bacterium]
MASYLGVKRREEEIFLLNFGKVLKQLRIGKGLSQEDLANDCNIPINQIGRIERAEINTTLLTVLKIAKALNISFKDFFSEGFEKTY